jgi:hypothetical protein
VLLRRLSLKKLIKRRKIRVYNAAKKIQRSIRLLQFQWILKGRFRAQKLKIELKRKQNRAAIIIQNFYRHHHNIYHAAIRVVAR